MNRAPSAAPGFTLLEVMVAMAILASSLVVLLEIATNNVRATNHAKLTSTATFLARGKMVSVETQILEDGFVDTDQEDEGDFDDEGFPQFRWSTLIERVELPADLASQTQAAAGEAVQTDDPMQALTGMVGGLMGSFIEPVRVGLEESVRRVTLKVSWDEVGRGEQSLEVVTFMTDPAKLDQAMGLAQTVSGGGGGGGGSGGGGSGGGGAR